MGLILDSSVVIAAERRGDTVAAMLKQMVAATSDQRAVWSAVGLTELAHGTYRAQTAQAHNRRDAFLRKLLNDVDVYPYTKEAGRKDRRGAAEAGRRHSVRGPADRRYGARSGLLRADRQCTALPTDSRPVRDAALALAPQSYFFAPVSLTTIGRDARRSSKNARSIALSPLPNVWSDAGIFFLAAGVALDETHVGANAGKGQRPASRGSRAKKGHCS
jgi:predicted nucleic acid-binding protein